MWPKTSLDDISVIILAGGQGSRLNFINKGLIPYHGEPLIQKVVRKLEKTTSKLYISANSDLHAYSQYAYPVISDRDQGQQGPLAGILSCAPHIETPLTLLVPVDAPLFPENYPETMLAAWQETGKVCIAHDGVRPQYLFSLFETRRVSDLRTYYQSGKRSVRHWLLDLPHYFVDFSARAEAFININSPQDLEKLQLL